MQKVLGSFSLALCALALPAQGADAFTVYGAGAQSCSLYNEHAQPAELQFIEWTQGYMAAYAVATGGQAFNFSREVTGLLLNTYCGKNPDKTVLDAALNFMKSQEGRAAVPSPQNKPKKGT